MALGTASRWLRLGGDSAVVLALSVALAGPALADLKLCNRMSYAVEAAIGVEEKGAMATRGWFRLDPAKCRVILQGQVTADRLMIHARVLPVYGASPAPQGHTEPLCTTAGNFIIAAARTCHGAQKPAPFSEIKPSQQEDGTLVAYLGEENEYDDDGARRAGLQRLLVIAGYDARPIDGVDGPKTQAALAKFLADHGLDAAVLEATDAFDRLIDAVQAPRKGPAASGLAWCNDTPYRVMASVGTEEGQNIVTRGWYRIEPGKCANADITGQPRRIFSFAEAVDADGRALLAGGQPLKWGGSTILCTRETKFEINDHTDCAGGGLTAAGYIGIAAGDPRTIRLKLPQ
jgi:uncharacterized membrane protein